MTYRRCVALSIVVFLVLWSWPGLALASLEFPGSTLRLSLLPDDPFFIDGDLVRVNVTVSAATAVSGDIGLGVALSGRMAGPCTSPGDWLLVFLAMGTGGGSQCLSTWLSNPASRIAQFRGVTLPAGSQISGELLQGTVTPSLPRGTFVFFGYILNSANPALILDGTTTTLDLE